MGKKHFRLLRYLFTAITSIFFIFVLIDPIKQIFLGFLTLSSSIAMLMYVFEVKREEGEYRHKISSIISCVLFFAASIYIFSVNLLGQ